ncbi:hypothetical protein QBC47DRAFT_168675 [Echria macrotheca]|uniref:Uncharacterized protein n=1 Tax=Echria macrotheca TaxID=438768 RepID=A0AAJ0BIY3_9PEZI|nr:hypothetical protein QBC47DRAFT_168675 [Echria macrotheca]
MGRASPPLAILAPPGILGTESTVSDLPLRNFPKDKNTTISPTSLAMPPTPPEDTPGLSVTSLETPNTVDQDLATPSSTIVEFDDALKDDGPPAVEVVNDVFRPFSRSRSRSGNSEIRGSSRNATPRPAGRKARSQSRSDSRQRQGRDHSAADNVTRYLRGMARSPPSDTSRELIQENTSLQQRIAALQRTERDLLTENHDLAQQLAALRQHHEARRKKWRDQYREREQFFHDRIRQLEDRIIRQDQELRQFARAAAAREDNDAALSDIEVMAWFTTRTISWQAFADEFAHHDPKRLQSGLHPVQMLELCDSVKPFVRINDDGLPTELLNSDGNSAIKPVHVLLHAMLANFIIKEAIESPFWMFNVLSNEGMEVDSPSVIHADSPIGFRMDLAAWHSLIPPRNERPSALPPKTARMLQESQQSRRVAPATSMPSLSLNTAGLSGVHQSMPNKNEMENLYKLLSNVQRSDREKHAWRCQLIRTLSEGGLSLEPEKVEGEERRRLADARKTHARNLKDRFLNSSVRFLLEDQDPAGIEKLELRLVKEFDSALKFSCHLWSRRDPIAIKSLEQLANTVFSRTSQVMELCAGQAPISMRPFEDARDLPPAYHDGHSVVMAVQPAIESLVLDKKGVQSATRVLSKAKVVVAAPKPKASDACSVKSAASNKTAAWTSSPAAAAAPVELHDASILKSVQPEMAVDTRLPGVAFKPASSPMSSAKRSPAPAMLTFQDTRVEPAQ